MPMPEIVKVRFKSRFQPGEWSPREYSYYAAVPLKVGDLVVVPSKYGESVAKVSQVHVDEREVRDYRALPDQPYIRLPCQYANGEMLINATRIATDTEIAGKEKELLSLCNLNRV